MIRNAVSNNKVLKKCEVFATLSNPEIEKIMASASERHYGAGEYIFSEGDAADELFVLQEGKVALQMTLQSGQGKLQRRVSIDIVAPYEVFGWRAVVEPAYTHTLTAVCLQDTTLIAIPGNALGWFLRDNPGAAFDVLKKIINVVSSRLEDTRHLLISERTSA